MDDVQMQLHVIVEIIKNAIASKDHSFATDSNWLITFDLAGILDKSIRASAVDMKHIEQLQHKIILEFSPKVVSEIGLSIYTRDSEYTLTILLLHSTNN